MRRILNLVMFVGWIVVTVYMPTLICGYGWRDLYSVMNSDSVTADLVSSFLNVLGVSSENYKQTATKYFIISIVISVVILICIVIISQVLKKYVFNKNKHTVSNSENKQ